MAKATPANSANSDAKAVAIRELTNDELLSIGTFEDALALVQETYGDVLAADEVIGNGFKLLKNKDLLVGVAFVALKWKFLPGDFGRDYTNILLVTEGGDRYLMNDGGAGITRELQEFSARTDRMGGVVFRNGLTSSTYDFCGECRSTECDEPGTHKMTPATTHYLDLSA